MDVKHAFILATHSSWPYTEVWARVARMKTAEEREIKDQVELIV